MQNRPTYLFYDLETSGLSPSDARIMQFAAQRTDLNFQPTEPPLNLIVRLDDDTLPSPGAILTTKITPQFTLESGIPERELATFLSSQVFTPNTIVLGFNSVRFDDKFIQHLFWRNFFPPYDWMWKDGRSRWDMLDVVRMTRALRPEGINWPFTEDGHPTNRLELITKQNGISHESAHDALSDVNALIDVTRLISEQQPKLFSYLFRLRQKKEVRDLVNLTHPTPFVYTSGRYGSTHLFTTIAYPIAPAKNGNILVYDLRYNIEDLLEQEQAELTQQKSNPDYCPKNVYYPAFKELAYNKCPAVAPLLVLDKSDAWNRLELSQQQVEQNLNTLLSHPEIIKKVFKKEQGKAFEKPFSDPESSLYDSFTPDADQPRLAAIREKSKSDPTSLADFHPNFLDDRLPDLLVHYKAKNFPDTLTPAEQSAWQTYRSSRLSRQSASFLEELNKFSTDPKIQQDSEKSFLLSELSLYYQSLQEYDIV